MVPPPPRILLRQYIFTLQLSKRHRWIAIGIQHRFHLSKLSVVTGQRDKSGRQAPSCERVGESRNQFVQRAHRDPLFTQFAKRIVKRDMIILRIAILAMNRMKCENDGLNTKGKGEFTDLEKECNDTRYLTTASDCDRQLPIEWMTWTNQFNS